jgi:CMP-N-acetylneuraminic acid synthetase
MSPIVALLPIKGHSERVPGKNFRPFSGKPLFRWILDTLLELQEISFVVINTDARFSLEECGVKESERVKIRDRNPAICGDFVSINLILQDDISAFSADTYLMTHATNPLLSSATIRAAIQCYQTGLGAGHDSLFTVNRYQSRFYYGNGTPLNHDPSRLIRTQDLDPIFEENSNLYLFTKKSFMKAGNRIGNKPCMMVTPPYESLDIDDQGSWDFAERLARSR